MTDLTRHQIKRLTAKNERRYYDGQSILKTLQGAILEHPQFETHSKYVSVNMSKKGNPYLTLYFPERRQACSVMWFAGSKDRPRGFRCFYPFGTPAQKKRDFRLHFTPLEDSRGIISRLCDIVANYVVQRDCFTEPEPMIVSFCNKPEQEDFSS